MAQVRVSVCVCSVVWCPCDPHIAQAVVADRLSLFRTVMPPVVQYPVHDVSYPFFKVRAALLALPLTVLLTMLRDCATHHATCRATHHATCLCYSPRHLPCYAPCYVLVLLAVLLAVLLTVLLAVLLHSAAEPPRRSSASSTRTRSAGRPRHCATSSRASCSPPKPSPSPPRSRRRSEQDQIRADLKGPSPSPQCSTSAPGQTWAAAREAEGDSNARGDIHERARPLRFVSALLPEASRSVEETLLQGRKAYSTKGQGRGEVWVAQLGERMGGRVLRAVGARCTLGEGERKVTSGLRGHLKVRLYKRVRWSWELSTMPRGNR